VSKKRDRVKRKYPLAICVPWWEGDNAYQIWKDANPIQETPLGKGKNPGNAWADAARNLTRAQADSGK